MSLDACKLLLASVVAVLTTARASAVTLTVGSDAACTHGTVQAALDAARASNAPSIVRVARNASYVQQALSIDAIHPLEVSGGYADCGQPTPDGTRTTLDGAGGATASVLRIITATDIPVVLRLLRIQHGDVAGAGFGGGVFFGGNGSLEVHDSAILDNVAGNGGGLYAGGAGNRAELIIGADVAITGNDARFSGGGVFVDGLVMTMVEPDSIIAFNTALGTSTTGYGGGLFIRALEDRPAIARIGTAGSGTLGAVYGNEARAGGGVAVIGNDFDHDSVLELFSVDPARRAAVRSNVATVAGGGLFVQSGATNDLAAPREAIALLWNAELTDNRAPDGAAVYLAFTDPLNAAPPQGGRLFINGSRPDDAPPCDPAQPCGEISANVATTTNGVLTEGRGHPCRQGGRHAHRLASGGVRFQDNVAGRLVDLQPESRPSSIVNVLVTDNQLSVAPRACARRISSGYSTRRSPTTPSARATSSASIRTSKCAARFSRSRDRRSCRRAADRSWSPTSSRTSRCRSAATRSRARCRRSSSIRRGATTACASASPAVDAAGAVGGLDAGGATRDVDLARKLDANAAARHRRIRAPGPRPAPAQRPVRRATRTSG